METDINMVFTHDPMTWWGHGVQLGGRADVSTVLSDPGGIQGGSMFIFQRFKNGVYQMEGFIPAATYNINESRTCHILGGCADVEITRPNADSSESTPQSSQCSPEV